jgi:glycosyltransferase involved in cell wall biosynthesis
LNRIRGSRLIPSSQNGNTLAKCKDLKESVGGGMRILFLARSMFRGGSERQLVVLATALQQRGHEVAVALFYGEGELIADLRRHHVQVIDLQKRGRWDVLGFGGRLVRLIRDYAPDVVHGYLPVPNCLALLAQRLSGRAARVVFGVRASFMQHSHYDGLSRLSYRLEERLSRWADLTIANSQAGWDRAVTAGFPADRTIVIENGIDTDRFCPNPAARQALRHDLGVGDAEQLVGMVGRLDPMKDHPTFLQAASLVAAARPDIRFVCVGDGPEEYGQRLRDLGRDLGDRLLWVAARQEVELVYPALDLLVSASIGEGFPNVVAEAMACDVPCVVTDVGDCKRIVADETRVILAGDPHSMAHSILSALANRPSQEMLRHRIIKNFSITRLVTETENKLIEVCAR